jgi:hypothetical protein
VATFGDSTANVGQIQGSNTVPINAISVSGSGEVGIRETAIFALPIHFPMAQLIGHFGIDGNDTFQMLQPTRLAPFSGQPMSIQDLINAAPQLVILRGGSINDLQGVGSPAEVDTAVGNCLFNHRQILSRMVNGGLKVLDCGIFGYGDDTFPLLNTRNFIRDALVRVNNGLATMIANDFSAASVRFVNPAGTLHDGTGKYINGMTNDGLHPSLIGGLRQSQLEAAAITGWLGAGAGVAYPDPTNLMSNAVMAPGTDGAIPTGYDAFGFNTTPGTFRRETIGGKTHFTMLTQLPTGNSNVIVRLPFAQSLNGIGSNEAIGCEFDLFYTTQSGSAAPRLIEFNAVQRYVWGGNTASHFAAKSARGTVATLASLTGRAVFLPFRLPTSGSSFNSSETRLELNLGFQVTSGTSTIKVGIGNPRLVRVAV